MRRTFQLFNARSQYGHCNSLTHRVNPSLTKVDIHQVLTGTSGSLQVDCIYNRSFLLLDDRFSKLISETWECAVRSAVGHSSRHGRRFNKLIGWSRRDISCVDTPGFEGWSSAHTVCEGDSIRSCFSLSEMAWRPEVPTVEIRKKIECTVPDLTSGHTSPLNLQHSQMHKSADQNRHDQTQEGGECQRISQVGSTIISEPLTFDI